MGHYKISKLLNVSTLSKFLTIKQTEVNDLPSGQYSVNKKKRFKTANLRPNLCDYSDAYIILKGTISVTGNENANRRNKELRFQHDALFRSCI